MAGPIYVAIEGPIGVGKSTLTHALAERLDARTLLEIVEENPFLGLFYTDRDRYAFQTQIFFLMSRFKQQQALVQGDLFSPNVVADYHLIKDRIFAKLTLTGDELSLYERVYQSLETQILKPDVLIYLHARHDVLMQRIQRRDRPFERNFDPEYLRALAGMYREFFGHYRASRVLDIDTSDIDVTVDPAPFDRICEQVLRMATDG